MDKKHQKVFERNINLVARNWQYYIAMGKRASEDIQAQNALDDDARFWIDHNYSSLLTVIIILGKIFDPGPNTFNISKFLKSVFDNISYFSRPELKKRKIEWGGDPDVIEEYLGDVHELSPKDRKIFKAQIKNARIVWNKIKPLRDQVFAHDEELDEIIRDNLYQNVAIQDIEKLIQILLNVAYNIEQAELNGRKPDFKSDHTGLSQAAKRNMNRLIDSLIKGKK